MITDDQVATLLRDAGNAGPLPSPLDPAAAVARARTDRTRSRALAGLAVAVAVQPAADIGGIVATGITIAQSAWGDALAEVLMRGRGYTWAEFMTTHPAGAVGRLEDLPADADRIVIPAYREVAS